MCITVFKTNFGWWNILWTFDKVQHKFNNTYIPDANKIMQHKYILFLTNIEFVIVTWEKQIPKRQELCFHSPLTGVTYKMCTLHTTFCLFSFIHSRYFYDASSSPLLLWDAPDYTGNCEWRTFPRPMWRLECDSTFQTHATEPTTEPPRPILFFLLLLLWEVSDGLYKCQHIMTSCITRDFRRKSRNRKNNQNLKSRNYWTLCIIN